MIQRHVDPVDPIMNSPCFSESSCRLVGLDLFVPCLGSLRETFNTAMLVQIEYFEGFEVFKALEYKEGLMKEFP